MWLPRNSTFLTKIKLLPLWVVPASLPWCVLEKRQGLRPVQKEEGKKESIADQTASCSQQWFF